MTPQEIYMELARISSFENYDGQNVCKILEKNRDLWVSMIFGGSSPGITLRDMHTGYHNADTMWLLVKPDKAKELELLVLREFRADAVEWEKNPSSFLGEYPPRNAVLMVWWD